MRRSRPLTLTVLLAASLALSGCASGPNGEQSSQSHEQSVDTLDLTVTDEALGHVIQTTGIVRHFEDAADPTESMGEFVLINVTATTGTKYSGTWGPSNTFLRDSSGEKSQPLMATQILTAMNEAGFTAFNVDLMQPGETASGWIPYRVSNAGSETLDFVTKHLAAKVMNGPTIEAEEYSIRVAG